MDPEYMGRLRSVWHRRYGRGSIAFEDALQDCCVRYASFYGAFPASTEQTRRQFAGLLDRHTRNMYHEANAWPHQWPEGPAGNAIDFEAPQAEAETRSDRTNALLLEVVHRLDRLSKTQRAAFLAYCDFVEDHGGGSNEAFRAYAFKHHGLDQTTDTIKAHLNAARRRLWARLVADGVVSDEPLQLKKARSRWDHQHTAA